MIVEDTPNVRNLIEIALRFKGYPVITASNGQEAFEKITSGQLELPALVITDILMPKMDGYRLAYKLRSDPLTSSIPIIFVSATYITPEDRQFAFQLGVARFIEKPIDLEDFLLTVGEILTETPPPAKLISEGEFYRGYRDRLESKLRHKVSQIARTERLIQILPEDQKSAFESLLEQTKQDRDQIQAELDGLQRMLKS